MSAWEENGKSDEWYTPAYIFDALGENFDLDVAAPLHGPKYVPARAWYFKQALELPWRGFVWMNPPYGKRNGLDPWLCKFFDHGNGVAITPDRTSAPWFQRAMKRADAVLLVSKKIKFERPDGTLGVSPGTGSALFASGPKAITALKRASQSGLGIFVVPELQVVS